MHDSKINQKTMDFVLLWAFNMLFEGQFDKRQATHVFRFLFSVFR